MRLAAFTLTLGIALAACAAPPQGLAADLPGSSWTLERIVDADGTVRRGSGERLTFGVGGDLSLASCNTCNGRYRVRQGALDVQAPLACTRRACPAGTLELERYLAGDVELHREGEYLLLDATTEAGTAQLMFLPAP